MPVRTLRPRSLSLAIHAAAMTLALAGAAPDLLAAEAPAASSARSYDIAPGPLGRTLSAFASDNGVSLAFDPVLAEGRRSAALRGRYAPVEALHRLLLGSGLELQQRSDGGRQSNYETIAANSILIGNQGDIVNSLARQRGDRRTYSAEVGLRGNFDTGPLRHDWTLSANRLHERLGMVYAFTGMQPGNLYQTSPHTPLPDFSSLDGSIPKTNETDLGGVALADRLSFLEDRVQVTLGVRRQQIESRNYDQTSGARTSHDKRHVWTPMASVLVKPLQDLSLYANYIQGLSQGEAAPMTAANAGQVLAPYKAEQYEIGAKYDLGGFTTTLALFEIRKPNAYTDASNVFRADGEQRNRGVELSLYGEPLDGVRVMAGATYIKPEQNKTGDPASEGKDAPGVARRQANLGVSWDTPFVDGLTLDSRWIYTGSAYVDSANALSVPHWNRVDLGAAYAFQVAGKPLVARANLENALGKDYWTAANGYLSISSPRTLSLSLTADF
ncbi:TonB-dependent receptor domain-containing protein [Pseudomonas aeruginosa]|nr:TonB-dependent receptor [Pseudomonas aeruginosa]HCR1556891.1 TonB-dependent receptor [Pseudomonas aeruginosa]